MVELKTYYYINKDIQAIDHEEDASAILVNIINVEDDVIEISCQECSGVIKFKLSELGDSRIGIIKDVYEVKQVDLDKSSVAYFDNGSGPTPFIVIKRRWNDVVFIIQAKVSEESKIRNGEIRMYSQISPGDIYREVWGNEVMDMLADIGKAKRDIILNADINANIAYLEAQLDIVTSLLISVIDNLPKAQFNDTLVEHPYLTKFIEKFNEGNLLNIKSVDSCIGELDTKSSMRKLQANYYEKRKEFHKKKGW